MPPCHSDGSTMFLDHRQPSDWRCVLRELNEAFAVPFLVWNHLGTKFEAYFGVKESLGRAFLKEDTNASRREAGSVRKFFASNVSYLPAPRSTWRLLLPRVVRIVLSTIGGASSGKSRQKKGFLDWNRKSSLGVCVRFTGAGWMLVPEETTGSPFQRGRNGARDACASLGSLTNINSHPPEWRRASYPFVLL